MDGTAQSGSDGGGRALVRAEGVSVRAGSRTILEDISLEIRSEEVVSIVGPNGGGKTTLLKVLIGSREPSAGTVLRAEGLTVGYQPQRTRIEPSMPMSVRALLRLAAPGGSDGEMAAALEGLGLSRGALDSQATELSGGERQLVMIARAMLCRPQLLVLDEPGTYCDPHRLSELYAVIERFVEESKCATVLVSHDISRVLAHSDRIHCIDVRLLCEGGPEQVSRDAEFEEMFGEPAHTGIYRHRH